MNRGNLAEVALSLETVDNKTVSHVERCRRRDDAEFALDLPPSELVVECEPFREQQRYFEALAPHRIDREPHQRRRNPLVPILLEREHGTDAAHRHRLPVKTNRAIENLNRRNQLPTITGNEAEGISKPRIEMIVPLEKRAVAIPPSEQVECFVPLGAMRSPNFQNLGL